MKAFLLLMVPAVVLGQCLTGNDADNSQDPSDKHSLYKGQLQFALNMLNVANDLSSSENVFFSPFSVYNALILAYFTASNHTEESLQKALFVPPAPVISLYNIFTQEQEIVT